jgi:hypothetical protein
VVGGGDGVGVGDLGEGLWMGVSCGNEREAAGGVRRLTYRLWCTPAGRRCRIGFAPWHSGLGCQGSRVGDRGRYRRGHL